MTRLLMVVVAAVLVSAGFAQRQQKIQQPKLMSPRKPEMAAQKKAESAPAPAAKASAQEERRKQLEQDSQERRRAYRAVWNGWLWLERQSQRAKNNAFWLVTIGLVIVLTPNVLLWRILQVSRDNNEKLGNIEVYLRGRPPIRTPDGN